MITGHPVLPIGPSPTNEIAFKSRLWRREGRGFEFVEVELSGHFANPGKYGLFRHFLIWPPP